MKRLLLAFALTFAFVAPVLAQDEAPAEQPAAAAEAAPAPAPATEMDTNTDGKVDAAEAAAATDAEATTGDVINDAGDVADAVKALGDKKSPMSKGMAWALLLGAVFKLLLSGLKLVKKWVAWFGTKEGKRVVKYSTLGLGGAAMVCANLAFGMPWMEAVYLLLSGPLAVAIHEYTKDSKDAPADPPADAEKPA